MAKPVKKKAAAKKKKIASKAVRKKSAVKKAVKKKVSSKKKASAMPQRTAAAQPVMGNCFCLEKDGLFYCMKKQPNGTFRECPTTGPFETMEECMAASC
jgi:hypothetical protein